MYYCYLLRCSDDSLYCGVTNDLTKRIGKHNSGSREAAKYTRSRLPVVLVYFEEYKDKQSALKREFEIKKLTKKKKEQLISFNDYPKE